MYNFNQMVTQMLKLNGSESQTKNYKSDNDREEVIGIRKRLIRIYYTRGLICQGTNIIV